MGWEMIPAECFLRFAASALAALFLGGFSGWAITNIFARPEWLIRQEVAVEMRQKRKERRSRRRLRRCGKAGE